MHFLIQETLSFYLMYVAACYPVGTTISKISSLFTALLQHYHGSCIILHRKTTQKRTGCNAFSFMLSSHQRRFDGALKRRAKRHQSVTKLD